MEKGRLNCIKRKIENLYNIYTGEIDRRPKVSISELAGWFEISIDSNREDEYYIDSIDFDTPAITIVDEGTHTAYRAYYTGKAEMLNATGKGKEFIEVVSSNSHRKVRSLYLAKTYDGDTRDRHLITRMTIRNGEYELSFTKESGHSVGVPVKRGNIFTICYSTFLRDESDSLKRQELLKKVYQDLEGNLSFERMDTYSDTYFIGFDYRDQQTKCSYAGLDEVAYNIVKRRAVNRQGRLMSSTTGFCLENLGTEASKKVLITYEFNNKIREVFPEIGNVSTKSAIYLTGFEEFDDSIKIYKNLSGIHVEVTERKFKNGVECNERERFSLPVLSPGNISIDEIDSLIDALIQKYGYTGFIRIAVNEIAEFRKRICINRGLTPREEDLDPKKFMGLTLDKIEQVILENRDVYFEKIDRQFVKNTHLSVETLNDIKSFKMKPTTGC